MSELKFTGQFGQDKFLDQEVFLGRENGTFVEIGSADPIHGSNSFFFETYRNWKGVCIEARSSACKIFNEQRKTPVINAVVGKTPGKTLFLELGAYSGIAKYMSTHEFDNLVRFAESSNSIKPLIIDEVLLEEVIKDHSINPLDLLMIDTEGAEETILRASEQILAYTKVILAECNTSSALQSLITYLESRNFIFVKSLAIDNVFINRSFAEEFQGTLQAYAPAWNDTK